MKIILVLLTTGLFFSCAQTTPEKYKEIELKQKSGSLINGEVKIYEFDGSVKLNVRATNVRRNHKFAAHIHENADCSSDDAKSAGGHFSPNNNPHGKPENALKSAHFGDLGNITSNFKGIIDTDVTIKGANLNEGDRLSLLGRSLVIHAYADDYTSQPAGDAGKRIACAEII